MHHLISHNHTLASRAASAPGVCDRRSSPGGWRPGTTLTRVLAMLVVILLSSLASAGEMLVNLGPDATRADDVEPYAAGIAADTQATRLGINSAGTTGQTNFDDQQVTITFTPGWAGIKMAAFSDDGVTVTIRDVTPSSSGSSGGLAALSSTGTSSTTGSATTVLSYKGTGQALPILSQSLKDIDYTFEAHHTYEITVDYLNTYYTGDGDVDGAQLIAYGPEGAVVEEDVVLEKIVIAATPERDGPAIMTAGQSITLRAKLNPANGMAPPGKPVWSVKTKPNGVNNNDIIPVPADGNLEVSVTVPKVGQYIIEAELGGRRKSFEIYAYTITLNGVTFAGTGYTPVYKDNNGRGRPGPEYEKPHFEVLKPQPRMNPVSYRRDSKLTLEVLADVTGNPQGLAQGEMRTVANNAFNTPAGPTTFSAPRSLKATLTTNESLPNTINMLTLKFDYQCRMRDDPPGFWDDIGSSMNLIYVTLEAPQTTQLYQTFVDVGCTNGLGAIDNRTAFEKIWSGFKARVVHRYDGALLTYYNPALKEYGICSDAIQIISQNALPSPDPKKPRYSIGNCIAWAEFLHACLLAQGIAEGQVVTISAISDNDAPRDGFLVKNWTTNGDGPYQFAQVGNTAVLVYATNPTVVDERGIEGQSNPDPPANFKNHYIYEYPYVDDNAMIFKYWDPSYGSGPFIDDRDYEDGPNSPIEGLRMSTLNLYEAFLNDKNVKELQFTP